MRRLCYTSHYLSSLEEVIITGENSGKPCKVIGVNLEWNITFIQEGRREDSDIPSWGPVIFIPLSLLSF